MAKNNVNPHPMIVTDAMEEHYADRAAMFERIIIPVFDIAKRYIIEKYKKMEAKKVPKPKEQLISTHLDQQRKAVDKKLETLVDEQKQVIRTQIFHQLKKNKILVDCKTHLMEEIGKLEEGMPSAKKPKK